MMLVSVNVEVVVLVSVTLGPETFDHNKEAIVPSVSVAVPGSCSWAKGRETS